MYQFIDIDRASELVKDIIESNRCAVCDKSVGKRVRYPCGCTSCDDCVPPSESCPFCLTPQDSSTFAPPSIDEPYTARSRNAIALLTSFQTDFDIDVFKRQRIAEQLKVEKELFPECIQAPAKYYNKKKSSKYLTENKENTFFPGEQVTVFSEMERSNISVQEWLNKCPKRKPLGDINHTINDGILLNQHKDLNTQNVFLDRSHRKRTHTRIWSDENKPVIDQVPKKAMKKSKVLSTSKSLKKIKAKPQNENKDDSGVAVDDNSLIVIEDSQSITHEKDMQAWLAVLETEKNRKSLSTIVDSKFTQNINHHLKVPFYKKGNLAEVCKDCNEFSKLAHVNADKHKNVSITIESNSFTAVVEITKVQDIVRTKQSVEVQTDFNNEDIEVCQPYFVNGNEIVKDLNEAGSPVPNLNSEAIEDTYIGEANVKLNPTLNKSNNVIVEESDSEDDIGMSTSMTVVADVHRSNDDIFILGDVEDVENHSKRARRAARGHTPTSTDSSEKENFNPNRKRKPCSYKKKPAKK